MAYAIEDQETFIKFDARDKQWSIETSYYPHIQKVMKLSKAYEVIESEKENNSIIWLRANMKIGNNFSINVFPKKRRKMSVEQRNTIVERLKHSKEKPKE